MGQRGCKVNPMIGEVCDQHPGTPPTPSINTAGQHPHPRDESPVGVGEGNSQERRAMERGGGGGESGGGEEERKESGSVQEKSKKKKWWRRLLCSLRASQTQPPESSSGQGEEKQQPAEGEQRKTAGAARSSDDYIFSRYSIGDQLGQGDFGEVYEGRRLDDDLKVALKYVTKTQSMECLLIPDHPNPLPKEIALTILANKGPGVPEIIGLLDWQDRPDHCVMIFECPSPCESLSQYLRRHGGRLREEKARHVMLQVACAVDVCCFRGVFHHDLNLGSFLINSETLEVKLIDFGCGDLLSSFPYRSSSGTADSSPPELCVRGMDDGRKATAWSLGMLMFRMLSGHFPSDHDRLILKRKGWSKPKLSTECCHLLNALLRETPSLRLGPELMLSHVWFKDFA